MPNCPADSAKLPSAQAESGRQWNTFKSTKPSLRKHGTPCITRFFGKITTEPVLHSTFDKLVEALKVKPLPLFEPPVSEIKPIMWLSVNKTHI